MAKHVQSILFPNTPVQLGKIDATLLYTKKISQAAGGTRTITKRKQLSTGQVDHLMPKIMTVVQQHVELEHPKNLQDFIAIFCDCMYSLPTTEKMAILKRCLTPEIQNGLGYSLSSLALYS